MRRRLLNFAAAVSLVLCVATAALWVRSRTVVDQFEHFNGGTGTHTQVRSLRGQIVLLKGWNSPLALVNGARIQTDRLRDEHDHRWGTPALWGTLGFYLDDGRDGIGRRGDYSDFQWVTVAAPYWAIVVGTAMLPAAAALRRLRPGRPGLCPDCGYDLRATPARCPECGAVTDHVREPPHNPPMQRTATASSGAVK